MCTITKRMYFQLLLKWLKIFFKRRRIYDLLVEEFHIKKKYKNHHSSFLSIFIFSSVLTTVKALNHYDDTCTHIHSNLYTRVIRERARFVAITIIGVNYQNFIIVAIELKLNF